MESLKHSPDREPAPPGSSVWPREMPLKDALAILLAPDEQTINAVLRAAIEVAARRAAYLQIPLRGRMVSDVLTSSDDCAWWIEDFPSSNATRTLVSFAFDCAQNPGGSDVWLNLTNRAAALDTSPQGKQLLTEIATRGGHP